MINLKLAKKIRQGMREMAQTRIGGAIVGQWPDDYEGTIPRKRGKIVDGKYQKGELWATETTGSDGAKSIVPSRVVIRLRLTSPRQIYKRAKQRVSL
jgi:hypothetical protein